ncbi:dnaJ homolog subfamily C member 4 isoform X2 [Hyperolius riggenbachi]
MLWHVLSKRGLQICTIGIHRCAGTYSRSSFKNHYQVLGVGRNATSSEIKEAFFNLSKQCHPDTDLSNPLLHAQFVRINEAYNVLGKLSSRREYDQVLEAIQRHAYVSPYQRTPKSYSRRQSTTHTYSKEEEAYNWSRADDDSSYWSQFSPRRDWHEKKHQKHNKVIVWGCIILAFSSICMHISLFQALKKIREKELEEEQQRIMDFYNKTRENAIMNGINKQQEVLIKKHDERLKKLYGLGDDAKK